MLHNYGQQSSKEHTLYQTNAKEIEMFINEEGIGHQASRYDQFESGDGGRAQKIDAGNASSDTTCRILMQVSTRSNATKS